MNTQINKIRFNKTIIILNFNNNNKNTSSFQVIICKDAKIFKFKINYNRLFKMKSKHLIMKIL